jgi:hypothetical protein
MIRRIKRFLARLGLTGLVLVLVPLLVTAMWLRFFGLPQNIKERLIAELARRGLVVEVDRLLLDPSGAVLAKKLVVYRNAEREQVWVQLDQARIEFAWFSWWQGQPFIKSASVANATVSLPITAREAVTLMGVNAVVDLQEKELVVRGLEAYWHQIKLESSGRIQINGLPPRRNRTPEQIESLERLWRMIDAYGDEIKSETPILLRLEFETTTLHPELGKGRFGLLAKGARYRSARIEEMVWQGQMQEGLITMDDFHLKLTQGELGASGEWNVVERKARLEFSSNLDFTPLAPAFAGRTRNVLSSLSFDELPQISGWATLDWSGALALNVQADLDWRNFSYNNVRFTRLTIPVGYDGHRWLVPQAEVSNSSGTLSLDCYVDQAKPEVKMKVISTLDPTSLVGLGGEGPDRFLRSCRFAENGPDFQAKVEGNSLNPEDWKITGRLGAKQFSYKNIPIEELSADFIFAEQELQTANLAVKRAEGKLNGKVTYNFRDRWVDLKDFTSTLAIPEVAPILGPKFTSYMAPYRFSGPPALKVSGRVDLQAQKPKLDTDLLVEVEGRGMGVGFDVFRKPIEIREAKGAIAVVNRELKIALKSGEFCEGKLDGVVIFNLTPGQPDMQVFLNLNKNNCQQVLSQLFGYKEASGLLNASMQFQGQFGKTETLTGNGKIAIEEGNIMSIPFFGGLTGLLNAVIPNFAFNKARNARCTFTMKEGKVKSDDVEITSPTFSVIGNGDHDFVNDQLNFNVRVNIRGIIGLVFFPVSKLFEYHGSGSMKSPKWEPKIFSNGQTFRSRTGTNEDIRLQACLESREP